MSRGRRAATSRERSRNFSGTSPGCGTFTPRWQRPHFLTVGCATRFRSPGQKGRGRRLRHVWHIRHDPNLHQFSAISALLEMSGLGKPESFGAASDAGSASAISSRSLASLKRRPIQPRQNTLRRSLARSRRATSFHSSASCALSSPAARWRATNNPFHLSAGLTFGAAFCPRRVAARRTRARKSEASSSPRRSRKFSRHSSNLATLMD